MCEIIYRTSCRNDLVIPFAWSLFAVLRNPPNKNISYVWQCIYVNVGVNEFVYMGGMWEEIYISTCIVSNPYLIY